MNGVVIGECDFSNALVDGGDSESVAVGRKSVGEETPGKDSIGATGAKFSHAERSANVDVGGVDSNGLDLLIGQAGGRVERIELACMPMKKTLVASADPDVPVIPSQGGYGDVVEI